MERGRTERNERGSGMRGLGKGRERLNEEGRKGKQKIKEGGKMGGDKICPRPKYAKGTALLTDLFG